MQHNRVIRTERRSLRSTIAWLSICLLAAGWGPSLDAEVRQLWALFGAFGLSAALGLDMVHRARTVLRRREHRNQARDRISRSLETMVAQGDAPTVRCVPGDFHVDDIVLQDAIVMH